MTGTSKDQKRLAYQTVTVAEFRRLQRRIAAIIGLTGFGLPLLLLTAQWLLGNDRKNTFKDVCFHESLSHFYYSPFFGTLFVGSLTMIAVLLFLWRGESWHERIAAMVAAVFLLGVAYLPVENVGCIEGSFHALGFLEISIIEGASEPIAKGLPEFALFDIPNTELNLHHLSAFCSFVTMLYVVLWLFRRADCRHYVQGTKTLNAEKIIRNRVYLGCGAFMIVSAFTLGIGFFFDDFIEQLKPEFWQHYRITFWAEAIFIMSFSFAWLTKGRFFDIYLMDSFENKKTARPNA